MSLSEQLRAAMVSSNPGVYVAAIEAAIPVLEAAEAWAKAHAEPRDSWAPSQQQHRPEDAEDALLAALAAHGPSQEKERT